MRNTSLSIATNASDVAVGAVYQQYVHNNWQTLAYFSNSLKLTKRRYSTFDRELFRVIREHDYIS
uniref:Reverse transcriptase/retrotransposon-derived protein RNase H-like domain-containing protein n=1 Tax=Amphimedon queenslandica TaxID=400682 RepID=A0A1X7TV48_AMPQE